MKKTYFLVMKTQNKVLRLYKIFRIPHWIHFLGFPFLGVLISDLRFLSNLRSLFIVLILSSSLLSFAYSFNDYLEGEDKGLEFIFPVLLSLFILPFLNTLQALIALTFILLTAIYSLKLMYLPIVCTITNTVGFMLLFLIGFFTSPSFTPTFFGFFLLLAIYETGSQLIHEIAHKENDKKNGRVTTAIKHPRRVFFIYKTVLALSLFPLYMILKYKFSIIASILFTSFFITRGKFNESLRVNYKLFGVLVGIIYLFDLLKFQLGVF